MKKTVCILAALLAAALIFCAGRVSGVRHAICDAEIYTLERYNPADPDASAWNGYDQLIYIDLDGQTYEHGLFQG